MFTDVLRQPNDFIFRCQAAQELLVPQKRSDTIYRNVGNFIPIYITSQKNEDDNIFHSNALLVNATSCTILQLYLRK